MRNWQGLDIEAEGSGISAPLSYHVNLLGTLLGQVIREQAGEPVFAKVESIRNACKEAAAAADPDAAFDEIAERLRNMSLDDLFWLIRSFSAFFNLVNEAERQEIIRINREAEISEAADDPRKESIREAIYRLREMKIDLKELSDQMANRLDIQPTLTAHPTEARRGSILYKQKRIASLLSGVPRDGRLGPNEKDRIFTRIYHQIALLLATDDVRGDRLTVSDEVENGLYYCTTTIWETVPKIYRDLREALELYYDEVPALPVFLRYRSWIGGDRDGNPFVTPGVTRWAFDTYRNRVLELYRDEIQDLWHEMSLSALRVDAPAELIDGLAAAAEAAGLSPEFRKRYRNEPWRLHLSVMGARLQMLREEERAYEVADFVDDLEVLRRSLVAAGLGDMARYGRLAELIDRARVFGFHFVSLDIRQHSRIHEGAVAELLRRAGVQADYAELAETERVRLLEAELLNPRPLVGREESLPESVAIALDALEVARDAWRRDPEAIGSFVVSMTHEVSDLLEVLLLAKEAGLWRVAGDRVESPVDVVPLFETIDDLDRAGGLLESAFGSRVYRMHLAARGDFQEIMLGYSDSNKDGGYWMANWALEKGHERLAVVCREAGIDFRFFHGRGGSVGRGGGRANQAILTMPTESRNGRLRYTEQGEVISFRYALAPMARRHLEQIANAVMLSVHESQCDVGCSPEMIAMMDDIARRSMTAYRELIDHPDFWGWYREVTPIEHIGNLPIASRPVSRKSAQEVEFDDLRAIPWVFGWTQTRYNVPGWYGMGAALSSLMEEDETNLERLRRMWEGWTFFRTVLDNAQREMARARLAMAGRYARRGSGDLHEKIAEDFRKAREAVLKITDQEALMDIHPVIQKSIRLRNPYTDVLNLVQVELLERWRNAGEEERGAVRHALFLTIGGIAGAMQSTG
jgi:phosphoenolpyruvate carboxylase